MRRPFGFTFVFPVIRKIQKKIRVKYREEKEEEPLAPLERTDTDLEEVEKCERRCKDKRHELPGKSASPTPNLESHERGMVDPMIGWLFERAKRAESFTEICHRLATTIDRQKNPETVDNDDPRLYQLAVASHNELQFKVLCCHFGVFPAWQAAEREQHLIWREACKRLAKQPDVIKSQEKRCLRALSSPWGVEWLRYIRARSMDEYRSVGEIYTELAPVIWEASIVGHEVVVAL